MSKIKNRRHWGAGISVFLFITVFLLAGCDVTDLLDNSPMDYIEENLAVRAIGWEGRSVSNSSVPVQRPDGVIAIPPGNSVIAVKLRNILGLTVIPGLENTGSTGSMSVWTAEQENSSTILVKISGAMHGNIYKLTLTMQGPGGLEFVPYTLPELRCYYFNTDLTDLKILRWGGGPISPVPLSPNPFSAAVTDYTVVLHLPFSSTMVSFDPTLPPVIGGDVQATLNGTSKAATYDFFDLLTDGNNSLNIRVWADNGVTYKDYHVNIIKETKITVVPGTVEAYPVITFSGSPTPINPGEAVSITLAPASTPSSWYITLNGPQTIVFTTADDLDIAPEKFKFIVPMGTAPGFYTVNVIPTIGGIPYSGSFGLIVN
jgi:hypothetical protein